ncbi:hypothetical protein PR1_81 [Providencia phage vB_PreS_PR1]|uniref:Uncharacterized protein n=1 Tax=Providencia phage vB_PreS_PR1 TaxID=1931407 RepID=A0A1S6KV19_9CAUD|nr:hypothetical protein FDH30_gp134 [Providencia phage vB_PreS_PR1]AQT25266.1 hypothetical protein PR1_81 [Providencia phage vB_PreS_PR1]
MGQIYVRVTRLHDSMDCETCGGGYASGWRIECEEHPEVDINLVPFAHCYDSVDYDYIETVFREWIKKGIVIAGAPSLTEDQIDEWDFIHYLMPDLYQITKQSYINAKGEIIFYDEVNCKVEEAQLIAEYLSRVFNVGVHVISNSENLNEEIEFDDDY